VPQVIEPTAGKPSANPMKVRPLASNCEPRFGVAPPLTGQLFSLSLARMCCRRTMPDS
jgi:hypothetical protein